MKKFIKYGIVSAVGYVVLIVGTYFLVEIIDFSKTLSYFIVISIVYIWSYMVNTKFVFAVDFSRKNFVKYIIFLLASWLLNNIFFNIMVVVFNIQYLIAIILNIVLLGVARFFIQKDLVFNDRKV